MMSPVAATRDPEADGPMTSGMIALVPSAEHADHMAVDGGEDPADLHLTLAYLGDNAVSDLDAGQQAALHHVMAHLAADSAPINARVSGHMTFNPDGGPDGDRTPAAVHVVSDSPDLMPLREAAAAAAAAALPHVVQYEPYIPHITGAYDRGADALHYTGPVRLGALRVAIGGKHTDYPLAGGDPDDDGIDQDESDVDAGQDDGSPDESKDLAETLNDHGSNASSVEPPEADAVGEVTISEADLDAAFGGLIDVDDVADAVGDVIEGKASGDGPDHDTKSSRCLPDGSYRIDHPGHLKTAVHALTGGKVSGDKRAALRKHVIKHARRLGATNMVPDSIMDEKDEDKSADAPDVEVKRVVRTQAGSQRYHKPIGTVLGPPRDAAAARAQQNTDAVKAYANLLHGNTRAVAPLDKMDTGDLEDLTRVAYSYKSTDPQVVALRIRLANELARRGLDVKDYGALGGGPSTGGRHHRGKHRGSAVPLPKGVRAPHQEGGAVKSVIEAAELEVKAKYTAEQRRAMAKSGQALPDGSYPIKDRADLKSAIMLRNHGTGKSKATIAKHIVKCAKAIGATDMLPDDLRETKGMDGFSPDGTADAFTSGVLLGLSGLEPELAMELKAGPPGHTFPSPDPRAARLRKYWVHGPGAAKIRWGEPHDFDRCVVQMTKYVGVRAKGLCNIYHRAALHVAPGQEDKSSVAAVVARMTETGAEFKSANQLWVRDPSAVDGWRAYAPAWRNDVDLVSALKAEVKALTPLREDESTDEEGSADGGSDDDLMSALDRYAGMAEKLSPEDAYEQGMVDDVPWILQAQGDLGDPREADEDEESDSALGGDPDSEGPDSGGDDEEDDSEPGELLFADPDADGVADEDTGDDMTGEPDGGGEGDEGGDGAATGGIPAVAELLAELLADTEHGDVNADRDPGEDADAGQAQGDEPETHPTKRRKAPASATNA